MNELKASVKKDGFRAKTFYVNNFEGFKNKNNAVQLCYSIAEVKKKSF